MFSPSVTHTPTPSGSVRSSRRRQRPLSNDGAIDHPPTKRKRSTLNKETFLPPNGAPDMAEVKSQDVTQLTKRGSLRDISNPGRPMPVRGKKLNKGDGSIVLNTNDTYTVSKLPSLPDRLRAETSARQHGAIYSENGWALSLTHTYAIVWPYTKADISHDTHLFEFSSTNKHGSELLPLGTLVAPPLDGSDEPGLVVVMPHSGKVTYWEAVGTADTLHFLSKQKAGVEFTIPNIGSDVVTQILNAEPAGFILAFRSGKLAYLSVRGLTGIPGISIQYLSGTSGSLRGGIFGSIRGYLPLQHATEPIAAVRAGPPRSDRAAERIVVVATASGKLQSWKIHRGGHNTLLYEAEAREKLVTAMKETQPDLLSSLNLETFEILDFTFTPKSTQELQILGQDDHGDNGVSLLLLVCLSDRHLARYSLIEATIGPDEFVLGNVRPIKCYTTPVSRVALSKPRLYLPNPALVAYAVFDKAVVVLSMAKQPDSPDLQLRAESHILPKAFEDVADFSKDINVEIVGSGMEEPHGLEYGKTKYPAVVLQLRGPQALGGVHRISATNVSKLTSSDAQQVTAKGKLEQAVFFGTLENNPLSFKVRPELQFPPDQIGAAALELSLEILISKTPYIPSAPASIDTNLRKRAAALRHLAEYLQSTGVSLDRKTRWQLLWNAEKIEAASLIWKSYDASVRTNSAGQKRGLMADVIDYINESHKSNPVAEAGQLDRVRHWFVHDIPGIDIAIPWAYEVMKYSYQDGHNEHDFILHSLSEANDIVISALEGAFDFRAQNLQLYGLNQETLANGILTAYYDDLPEFWTSTSEIVKNITRQASLAGALLSRYCNNSDDNERLRNSVILEKVFQEYSRLLDLVIRSSTERVRWASAQSSPQLQLEAEELRSSQTPLHDEQIIILVDLGLAEEAIELSEKHLLMPTLAAIIMLQISEHGQKARQMRLREEDYRLETPDVVNLENRVRQYFKRFGKSWANAFYEHNIQVKAMSNLLESYQDQQKYLSDFLRSKPEYAKLSWLHEVIRVHNFEGAAETLLDLGLNRERHLWSKKIELSLGKMARLASRNYSQSNGIIIPDGGEADLAETRNQLGLIEIQDQLYSHVLPSIKDALDVKAEVSLAVDTHSSKLLKNKRASSALFEDGMERLIKHETMTAMCLIDVLSFMKSDDSSDDDWEFRSQQFYFALQALRFGVLEKDEQFLLMRIIWRRCILQDDWNIVNDTDEKHDEEINERVRSTALYMAYKASFKNRIFESTLTIEPVSPQDIVGAGVDELPQRFDGMDSSMKESLEKNMHAEDTALKSYIEKSQLEKWALTALDLARDDFKREVQAETNGGQKMVDAAKRLRDIEQSIVEREKVSSGEKLLSYKGKPKGNGKHRGSLQLGE